MNEHRHNLAFKGTKKRTYEQNSYFQIKIVKCRYQWPYQKMAALKLTRSRYFQGRLRYKKNDQAHLFEYMRHIFLNSKSYIYSL